MPLRAAAASAQEGKESERDEEDRAVDREDEGDAVPARLRERLGRHDGCFAKNPVIDDVLMGYERLKIVRGSLSLWNSLAATTYNLTL